MMQKPDVDQIDGLSPAISIEQKTTSRTRAPPSAPSPRSTTTCACSGRGSASPTRPPPACRSRARRSARWSTGCWSCRRRHRLYLLAPVVRGRKGEYRKELAEWQKKGFQRPHRRRILRHRGRPALDKKFKHDIDVVVDRIVVRARHRGAPGRLSLETARSPRARRRHRGRSNTRTRSDERGQGRSASPSPKSSPAPSPASPSPRSSRGCSPSTTPSGRLPRLRRPRREALFDPTWSCRTRTCRSRRAPSRPGPSPPRPITARPGGPRPRTTASDHDKPWNELPEKRAHVILHGTGRQDPLAYDDGLRKPTRSRSRSRA
jgi:excinuclease ABC subunit A